MGSTDVTTQVAEFVADTSIDAMSDAAREKATKHIVDTVAVMAAGTQSDLSLPLLKYVNSLHSSGESRIVVWGDHVNAEVAALANGTLAHALDYDDCNAPMRAHGSGIALGALFASPAIAGFSGRNLLEAYMVGTEAGSRIAQAVAFTPQADPGWHTTGTMGVFGAVAALSKLNGLQPPDIARALGIAGSMVSGLHRNLGTMTKPLHSGWAARSATAAVSLARFGWTANERILDGNRGFAAVFGRPDADTSSIPSLLANPYVFEEPRFGMSLKLYPCCYATHRAIQAVRELLIEEPLSTDRIQSVECRVVPGGLRPLQYPDPSTGLQGKFSMEYVLATAIVDGSPSLDSFTDAAVRRREVRELMRRIKVAEDEACSASTGGVTFDESLGISMRGAVEVVITEIDGSRHARKVSAAQGSPVDEISWERLREKFDDCLSYAKIDGGVSADVFPQLRDFADLSDVFPVLDLLRASP